MECFDDIEKEYLNHLAIFCFSKKKTNFQEKLLNSILIFSDGTRQKEIEKKLIFVFMSLESFLLKNLNEPIMQNVGERFAYIVGNNPDERIKIFDNFKFCYSLRSRFIHHSYSDSNNDQIHYFLINCYHFFMKMVANSNNFDSVEKLINVIKRAQFS